MKQLALTGPPKASNRLRLTGPPKASLLKPGALPPGYINLAPLGLSCSYLIMKGFSKSPICSFLEYNRPTKGEQSPTTNRPTKGEFIKARGVAPWLY
ncbi:MAG: hypothetical protein B6247_26745 [Candidatus Parabeggiatoa sp. nov. 2]|nr:MAG: hypothetical protein B6247_26745 [Beggiatoa sp. 4572_84]